MVVTRTLQLLIRIPEVPAFVNAYTARSSQTQRSLLDADCNGRPTTMFCNTVQVFSGPWIKSDSKVRARRHPSGRPERVLLAGPVQELGSGLSSGQPRTDPGRAGSACTSSGWTCARNTGGAGDLEISPVSHKCRGDSFGLAPHKADPIRLYCDPV